MVPTIELFTADPLFLSTEVLECVDRVEGSRVSDEELAFRAVEALGILDFEPGLGDFDCFC